MWRTKFAFLFLFFQQLHKCKDPVGKIASGKDNLSQEYRNRVFVFILIDYGGRQLCRYVFFKKENWSTDRVQLYKRIEPEQSSTCWFKNQHQILCPSSGIADHNDFDMTLYTSIIEGICGSEYESVVRDMRNLRNE